MNDWAAAAMVVFAAVMLACLAGIVSRPVGLLASIWPANAVLLALVLRWPAAARWTGWLAAAAAYVTADLLTGSGLAKALLLNSANMVSVGLAWGVLRRAGLGDGLRDPTDILWIAVAAALGGCGAGLVGGIANVVLFDGPFMRGMTFWWVTEAGNFITILPALLAAPWRSGDQLDRRASGEVLRRRDLLPLAAVLLSCTAALSIGGPGAIALPVLALLWCGLVYPVFLTALISMGFTFGALMLMAGGYLVQVAEVDSPVMVSLRLGVAVVATAPVLLAIVIRDRDRLNARLRHQADHDGLTGLPNRQAFLAVTRAHLAATSDATGLLMLDLDHFKSINDGFGHAAGDMVLRAAAARIAGALRSGDMAGRLGGEEFAVLLPECAPPAAAAVAERIRQALASEPVLTAEGRQIGVTVSIGLLTLPDGACRDADAALVQADAALYRAKRDGRDRVVRAHLPTPAAGSPRCGDVGAVILPAAI